jgi:AmmeMemoRadiSam system protein A
MCLLPEDSSCHLTHPATPDEFSPQERKLLLQLAHAAIAAALEQREISLTAPTAHLAEPRGAFTTLYYRGDLRGCVGYVFPVGSLYRIVAESARGAAFDDSRFAPVSRDQVPELQVSLSILSLPQPIQAEDVEIGRHGLLVKLGAYRGLLLPQVPVEHGWDRITFLEQTCRKAGLPPKAWQTGAQLEAFMAEVFGDRDVEIET